MLTIKSDDVYGRAKAYESIIKGVEIQGPKVPESFNVLVKELQGLGLKVDLLADNKVIDAETVLALNIRDEAKHPATIQPPQTSVDDTDVTEAAVANDFSSMEVEDPGDLTIDEEGLAAASKKGKS